MNHSRYAIWIASALCFGFAVAADAQTLKKYITPDGKTVYSDTPIPGAKEVGEIKPQPKLDPASSSRSQDAASKDAQALDKRLDERTAQRDRIAAAQAKLDEAKRTLEGGKEPLPGERIGTASGQSKLTDAYWERQKANQKSVENAQKALGEASAAK